MKGSIATRKGKILYPGTVVRTGELSPTQIRKYKERGFLVDTSEREDSPPETHAPCKIGRAHV